MLDEVRADIDKRFDALMTADFRKHQAQFDAMTDAEHRKMKSGLSRAGAKPEAGTFEWFCLRRYTRK